jgi:hypothetical protein
MKFALKDVLPNPYHDLVGYRYLDYKIEKLMESIRATGYGDNTVGRMLPDNKLQIACGHHRLEALRRLYPLDSEHEFIVQNLSNDAMMQMMARENDETYGGDLRTVMQNVAAVVQALARGDLSPDGFRIPENTPHETIRCAPSYIEGIEPSVNKRAHPYTVASVASYLGYTYEDQARGLRPTQKVQAALNVLELIELGFYRKDQLNDPRYQNDRGMVKVRYVLDETRDIRAKVAKTLSRGHRETAAATEQVRIMQERIEVQRQLQLELETAEKEELRKLSELIREANDKQGRSLVREAHARRKLIARQAKESREKAQELEKHLAEKKKMQAVAEKREREARAAAAFYLSQKEWDAQNEK